MQTHLLHCGYSYHGHRLHLNARRHAMNHYFFRYQSEGLCYIRVNDTPLQLVKGEVMLCKPGDVCEMLVD